MQWVILLIVSLVPGVAWVWYFNRQDYHDREPFRLLARAFVVGMLSVIPAALLEIAFRMPLISAGSSLMRFVTLVLFVGFVEEFAKFAAFYLAVYRAEEYNEPLDGIIYAVTAALGFATVENLLYTVSFGLSVAPARALIASMAHASFSGLTGYYVGLVTFRAQPWTVGLYGLGVASVLHGLYNFLIVDGTFPAWLAIPMIYGVYRFLTGKIRETRALSPL